MPIWPLALLLVLRIFHLRSCVTFRSIHRSLDDGELPHQRSSLTSHLDGVAVDYRLGGRHRDRRDESAEETSIMIERQADLSGVGIDPTTCFDSDRGE